MDSEKSNYSNNENNINSETAPNVSSSINQNDSSSSHNLSITTRRVTNSVTKPAKLFDTTNSPKSVINSRTGKAIDDDDNGDSKWFARHKLHEKQQQPQQLNQKLRSSFKRDFGSAFKKGIKFVAISFTALLAFNHCVVLVDYIYQGSMRFEELMFDFRLVITKISALIFVLTWHFNRTKVDKLIRLVKSTSIYILSTQNNNQVGDNCSVRKKLVRTFSGGNLTTTGLHLSSNNPRSWARGQAGERSFNEAFRELTKAQFEAIIKFNSGDKQNDKEEKKRIENKEVYLFTAKVNRSVLKWWLMCICVTIVHFSLSEAEIFKSHHLWTWLDDYSMHQLSNKTTSLTTLMFLASFDNYIYTVHVYGARLIGASIICIVCSLQRKNIDSLRLQALQMLQVSSLFETRENMRQNKRGKVCNNLVSRSEHTSSSSSNMRYIKHENIIVSKRKKLDELSSSGKGENTGFSMGGAGCMSSSSPSSQNNNNFDVSYAQTNPECNSQIDNEIAKSNNNIDHKIRRTIYGFVGDENDTIEISCPKTSRNLFFVLGESDWLEVEDNLKLLRPCGYLSSPLWYARKYLCFKVRQLIFGLVDIKKWKLFEKSNKKNKISCSRDLIMALNSSMGKRVESVRWCNFKQLQLEETQKQELCCRVVTPTSTCLQGGAKGETYERGKENKNEKGKGKGKERELPLQIDVTINAKLTKSNVCSPLNNSSYGESSFETTPNDEEIRQNDHHHNDHFHSGNDLSQQAGESSKTKVTSTTTTTPAANNHLLSGCSNIDNKSENLFFIQNKRQSNNQQELNDDDHLQNGETHNSTALKTNQHQHQQQSTLPYVNTAEIIEWQLERLASKYELVRTVNSRIDSCFGPMLLIQYSFLFLMSCIDVVYFSICFNPNTKTKYIIISGMILLWWPYLLLYKFASDIGSSSKELLISVRRLARLSLVEHHQTSMLLSLQQQQQQQQRQRRPILNKIRYHMNEVYGSGWVTCSPLTVMNRYHERPNLLSYHSANININGTTAATTTTTNNFHSSTRNSLLYYDYLKEKLRFQSAGDKKSHNYYYTKQQTAYNFNDSATYCLRNKGNYLNNLTSGNENNNCRSHSPNNHSTISINKTRARILNKLDHVFKTTNLSIIGIMTIDKFFLLNFAKIVITASVMVIQFISY